MACSWGVGACGSASPHNPFPQRLQLRQDFRSAGRLGPLGAIQQKIWVESSPSPLQRDRPTTETIVGPRIEAEAQARGHQSTSTTAGKSSGRPASSCSIRPRAIVTAKQRIRKKEDNTGSDVRRNLGEEFDDVAVIQDVQNEQELMTDTHNHTNSSATE